MVEDRPRNNVERLLEQLDDGSFAVELVKAHAGADAGASKAALQRVVHARLDDIRHDLRTPKN